MTVHQLLKVVNVSTVLKIIKFRIRYYICMHFNNQSLFFFFANEVNICDTFFILYLV